MADQIEIHNGMSATDLTGVAWRKSRRSGAVGNCVEVARWPTATSRSGTPLPNGPALVYTQAEITAFVGGVKDGEFDDLA